MINTASRAWHAPAQKDSPRADSPARCTDNAGLCTDAGFIKGVGQGLVGAAAQPVSGALDALSSAFEGIDATSNTVLGKLSNRPRAVERRRLPRAIGGDRRVQPFVRGDGTDTQVPPSCQFSAIAVVRASFPGAELHALKAGLAPMHMGSMDWLRSHASHPLHHPFLPRSSVAAPHTA